ncbi:MAG: diaminopimelate decarboxylase [Sphingomonadaceae bacterium]|nr:diaminopimelate decarboxylase [Sphingomonadaceae bacterium]
MTAVPNSAGFHRTASGALHCEGVALSAIADAAGTPVYVYSAAAIEERYRRLAAALPPSALIAYAVKANPNLAVVATLARLGAGADVVSGGELARARRASVPANRIVFSGVGKTVGELERALTEGILQLNVESEPELHMLSAVATRLGRTAPIALRVNPDVSAGTHTKISTGRAEDKFGIPAAQAKDAARLAASLPGLSLQGLAVHIGSQLTQLEPMERAFASLGSLAQALRAEGHAIRTIDLGGGLGVPYEPGQPAPPSPEAYGAMVERVSAGWGARLIFEPGRFLVAEAGVLVASTILVKQGQDRVFVVVDAAMNDLMRPTLYGAYHGIEPLEAKPGRMVVDVVGPACESGDTFAKAREIGAVGPGDRVALMTAGAYGASLASTYNSRPLVAEVLVRGRDWRVVANRVQPEAMMELEAIPDWG